MNFNKTLPFVLLTAFIIVISSCGKSDKNAIMVAGSKLDIELPSNYVEIDLEGIAKLLEEIDSADQKINLSSIEFLLSTNKNMIAFVDTTHMLNFITIASGPKLGLNAKTAEKLSELTQKNLEDQVVFLGGKVAITERAIRNGEHRYMKLKYKISMFNSAFYQTNYMVKGFKGIYGVSVICDTEEDFEDMVASLAID